MRSRRSNTHLRSLVYVLAIIAVVLLGAAPAHAGFGVGVRAGFSAEPDQVVVGGQAALGSIFPLIKLVPSADFGFGDDQAVTAINVDFQFDLPSLPKVQPNLYVGAGPTIAMFNPDAGGSHTEVGLSLVAGLRIPMTFASHYSFEARLGLGDIPELKAVFGIMFGLRAQ
jgi:hypothetical protein